jgi:hypothetical protein
MKTFGKIVLWLAGGFVVLFVLAVKNLEPDHRHPAEKIADACKREYGYSQDNVTPAEFECTVRALNRWAADIDAAKMSRVYRSAY